MGEIADDHIDRMLQEGQYPFGRPLTRARNRFNVVCDRCGMRNLKWRETEAGWRLFEDERVEHNRLKMHMCGSSPPLSDDEFDVIEAPVPIVFVIRYCDPETEEIKQVEQTFQDSHEPHFISAQTWAEGYAYGLADKGWYEVEPKRAK